MPRLRDFGLTLGEYPTGLHNAISDVPGVWVGHTTLIYDEPSVARTGVTIIAPNEGRIWREHAFAGFFSFNGTGEMTGIHWLRESGLLCSPIALTSTHQVGTAHEALVRYGHERGLTEIGALPVVAETWDGWLSDADAHPLTHEHVFAALDSARPGPVAEGCVGGGTGMICHDFKGGIGTASRMVETPGGRFTLGALVQANHGDRSLLRMDGVPVGRAISFEQVPSPWDENPSKSSIIVILATDAPLLPTQCERLARRATLGMARVGGVGYNGSGDLFLAFATGNIYPAHPPDRLPLVMLPHHHLNRFFEAAAEVVEEAILNTLTAATTTTGYRGRTAHALPAEQAARLVQNAAFLTPRQ